MTAAYTNSSISSVVPRWGVRWRPSEGLYERLFRRGVTVVLAVVILAPVLLVVYQSLLEGAFFSKQAHFSLDAYRYVLSDPDFYSALKTTAIFTTGMVLISLPLGAVLAFLMTRFDMRFKAVLEILILMPMFLSSLILAFGYVVTIGPQGFLTIAWRAFFGSEIWNVYSLAGMTVVAGLSHVPHVYLYVSSAMRNLPTELEEAAQTCGSGPWRVLVGVTLPLVTPALVFATMLNVLLGVEVFGIPLILGESQGIAVLTTYIYKLSTMLGTPSYELMAVVAVCLLLMTLPMVWLQRLLLRRSQRFAVVGGKGARASSLSLGVRGQILAMSIICAWLLVSVVLPISGVVVRAFVTAWGAGTDLWQQVSLQSFRDVLGTPALLRSIGNTILLSVGGGGIAVAVYLLIALACHRNRGRSAVVLDYLVLLPRALPGIIVGLAFLWLFLFVPFLAPIRGTLLCILLAYMVVGLSYGLRIIQSTLLQVSPELEEAARVAGASIGRAWMDVVVPIIRPGLVGAFLLIMIVFIREYSTGLYLMGSGTEIVGPLIITLTQSGNLNPGAVLALLNILMIVAALALALRLGARIRD